METGGRRRVEERAPARSPEQEREREQRAEKEGRVRGGHLYLQQVPRQM